MSNHNLFNQKEFPEWKGYRFNDKIVDFYHNTIHDVEDKVKFESMVKLLHESHAEKCYFKKILLYIQRKMYMDEPLNLCLNSAKEVFDIMITPCETLNNEGEELTLNDYNEMLEYTIESVDKDDPMSRHYMLCRTCDYLTENSIEFDKHDCGNCQEK